MRKSSKVFCLIFAVLMLFTLSVTAFAGNETNDGNIKIEVATNKGSYGATGVAEITATITNVSGADINNVTAQAVFNDLAPAGKRTSETSKSVDVLKSGESFSFTYKATLNKDQHKLNIFQKIILWFVRLFNGGYNANNNNIDVAIECVTEINFGKFTAENVVQVGYEYNDNNSDDSDDDITKNPTYEELTENVAIDEVYEHNEENLSIDSESGIQYTNNIVVIMFDWECTDKRKAEIINSINGKVVGGVEGYNELHIEIKNSTLEEIENICDELNKNDDIYATYDSISNSISKIPNDLYQLVDTESETEFDFLRNWENAFDTQSYTWSAVAIEAPGAWDYNDYFSTIKIGVVDSGFSTTNRDLELRIVSSENSPENHGTNVAGVIGATANNKTGLAGVVWNKNILAYDAWISGNIGMYESDIFAGIEKLVKSGCKVINLSLGHKGIMSDRNIKKEGKGASKKMAQLLEAGYDFIIVQAAGNGDANMIGVDAINNGDFCSITSENCYSNKKVSVNDIMDRIIIVANATRSVDGENNSYVLAESSNRGAQVDIAAPGSNVLTTTNLTDFPYSLESGTSIAAPFVTGVASLVWSVNPDLTGDAVREIVLSTAEAGNVIVYDNPNLPSTGNFYMVNAKLAVEEAIRRTDNSSGNTETKSASVNGSVVDADTQSGILGVKAMLYSEDTNQTYTVYTDENGNFSIKNLSAGRYTLSFEHELYVTNHEISFTLSEGLMFVITEPFEFVKEDDIGNNTTTVTGIVKDLTTENAISGAVIDVSEQGDNFENIIQTVTTNEYGEFSLSFPLGNYQFYYSATGYEKLGEFVDIDDISKNIDLGTIYLKSDSSSGGEDDRSIVASGNCGASNRDNVKWVLYSDGEIIINGKGKMENYSQDNDPPWQSYKSQIKKVKIENGVTTIGDYAFMYTASLEKIEISESVKEIGEYSFRDCANLNDFNMPKSVVTIGGAAFYNCDNLTSAIIPESVVLIGGRAFLNCDNLVTVEIYNGEIGAGAFEYCDNLTDLTLLDGVTSIGADAFADCDNLENLTVPDSVTNIDDSAFGSCKKLKNITLPNYLTHIGYFAFGNTAYINNASNWNNGVLYIDDYLISADKSVANSETIKNGTKVIADSAFRNCDSLTNIIIPESVISIGEDAFSYCDNLTSVFVSGSVTSIGDDAFSYCEKLIDVTIPDGVTSIGKSILYSSAYEDDTANWEDGNLYVGNYLIDYYPSSASNYTIRTGTKVIADGVFENSSYLTNVVIPYGVTIIGKSSFAGCNNLTSVTIPDSVTTIEDEAFSNCYKLSIAIPDSVESIGSLAFYNCQIISMGSGVNKIGDGAFKLADWNKNVIISDNVEEIGCGAFEQCYGIETIIVSANNKFYSSDSYGALFNKEKTMLIQYPTYSNVESYEIPNGVNIIGEYSFKCCRNLTSLKIPSSVNSIEQGAFLWIDNLTDIYYSGTEEEWDNISIAIDNEIGNVTIHYNS